MVSKAKCDVVDYCAVCKRALDPDEGGVCGSDCEVWCFDGVWSIDNGVVYDFAYLCIVVHDGLNVV